MLTQYTVCSAAVITSLYTIIYFTLAVPLTMLFHSLKSGFILINLKTYVEIIMQLLSLAI